MTADEPLAQQGDTRFYLLGRGLGDLGAAAARAQARMDGRMGFARAARPGGNQVLEFLALGGAQLVGGDTRILLAHFLSGAGLLLGGDLTRLAGAQQGRHLIGVQEAGNTEVFLFFLGADLGTRTPRGTVEEDAIELSVGTQDLK